MIIQHVQILSNPGEDILDKIEDADIYVGTGEDIEKQRKYFYEFYKNKLRRNVTVYFSIKA